MKIGEQLEKEIQYAKNSKSIKLLYQALGAIKMARQLKAISTEEYLQLDRKCVYEGINNPETFKWEMD